MEQIRIDLVPGGVTPNAHASQYDVGRAIRFLLYNGGSAYTLAGTETITVDVTKPDGSTDAVSVTNTSSNYVDFVTTDGLLNQAGLYPCEISIVNGTDVIGSQNFNLRAEADAYDGADIVTVTVGPTDICTFTTTLAEPLQSVIVNVVATGGNGTPDNPNPINGYTEANITANGDTVTIAFGQTVYGGVLDVTRGKLRVTHTYIKGGFEQYNASNGYKAYRKYGNPISKSISIGGLSNMINEFGGFSSDNMTKNIIQLPDSFGTCYMALDENYNANDVEICYEIATPFDIDLTPEVISALALPNSNNVFADCGQTEVKYLAEG